jgi:hypothetical protein
MDPSEFAAKWKGITQKERSVSQSHFNDLCGMLGKGTPTDLDPTGEWFVFEMGAAKLDGTDGFADVWMKDHFAWEYKGKHANLVKACGQLNQYREDLGNPPLLVVSDMDTFEIHTNFTGTVKKVHMFTLDDLAAAPAEPLALLRALFEEPERLRPNVTRQELTEEAAKEFANLAVALRSRGHDPQAVAHFLDQLLFCMFAEDAGLLPPRLIEKLSEATKADPPGFTAQLGEVFARMSSQTGGYFGSEHIEWFNGSLFDASPALPLVAAEVDIVRRVAKLDWAEIEPAIFGTLFERGLDPDRRSQLGAHYTDRASIVRLVEPVLMAPLRREYVEMQTRVSELVAQGYGPGGSRRSGKPENDPLRIFEAFLDRLRSITVLDPACGSGNFLYIALQSLKDMEREAIHWGSLTMRFMAQYPQVGPAQLRGIEVNPYAAELARVTIWIGEIQWMLRNGFAYLRNPILRPLHAIETRDALIDWTDPEHPVEADWPDADVTIGNPPFIARKSLRRELGDAYTDTLFRIYQDRVPREADFVTYWHEKARALVQARRVKRVGLLATQGIRHGPSRRILDRVKQTGDIFLAWPDEPWVLDGATVHVSLVGFDDGAETERTRNGVPVPAINSDLTAGLDLTTARPLEENRGVAWQGDTPGGNFAIDAKTATQMLASRNPDGRSNSDVIRPSRNGIDVAGSGPPTYIIDFGTHLLREEAALYEAPYERVERVVKPERLKSARKAYRERWWIHMEPRPGMRAALAPLSRYIATPITAKHRFFVWLPLEVLPSVSLLAVARDDDLTFGLLHSSPHLVWARSIGSQLRERESALRYTVSVYETFPFPHPTDAQRAEIAAAALRLDELGPRGCRRGGASAANVNRSLQRVSGLAARHPRAP